MKLDLPVATWRKSTFSGGAGSHCVELRNTLDAVRDSKNPAGPTLVVSLGEFLTAVKGGKFSR